MAAHTRLLNAGRRVIQELAEDPRLLEAGAATLCHADLHKRNIFVSGHDPSAVTTIIDWQPTSIEPAFDYPDYIPDFAPLIMADASLEGRAEKQAAYCRQVLRSVCKLWFQSFMLQEYSMRTCSDLSVTVAGHGETVMQFSGKS